MRTTAINLRQCWFPGVHSNTIGGWMIDQCITHGGLLAFNPYMLQGLVTRHRNPAENRDSSGFHTGGEITYPGWGCGTIYDSYAGKKSFLAWQYRAPGNYTISREHRGAAGFLQLPEIKVPSWVP